MQEVTRVPTRALNFVTQAAALPIITTISVQFVPMSVNRGMPRILFLTYSVIFNTAPVKQCLLEVTFSLGQLTAKCRDI